MITRQLMKHHKGECSLAVQDSLNYYYYYYYYYAVRFTCKVSPKNNE